MSERYIFDSRGRVIGRQCGNQMFDEHGKLVARYSSNGHTYDDHGKLVGSGDQRLRELGREEK